MVAAVTSGVLDVSLSKWPSGNLHGTLMNIPITWRLYLRFVLEVVNNLSGLNRRTG